MLRPGLAACAMMLFLHPCAVQSRRIDAAFNVDGMVIFISGSQAASDTNFKGESEAADKVEALNTYLSETTHPWRAAMFDRGTLVSLDDDKYHWLEFDPSGSVSPLGEHPYDDADSPFKDGGPDAAVLRFDSFYFFKGCEVFVIGCSHQYFPPMDLPAGVPCNLDAAWRDRDDENASVLLQGDTVWIWSANGMVTGPFKFHELYNLKTWQLDHVTERRRG